MQSLLLSLVAIALLDSLNPNGIALQIYLLSTPNPIRRSLAFALGEYVAAIGAGMMLLLGFGQFGASLQQWLTHFFGQFLLLLQFLIGVAIAWAGWQIPRWVSQSHHHHRPTSLRPLRIFWFGFFVAFTEAPTALPYLVAIEQIHRADLALTQTLLVLAIYNMVFISPLLGLILLYYLLRDRAAVVIMAIGHHIQRIFPELFRILVVVLGLWLGLDALLRSFGYGLR